MFKMLNVFLFFFLAAALPAKAETNLYFELPSGGSYDHEKASVYFVGNATLILTIGPFKILTDPNFVHRGSHVHIGYGLTAKRLTDPAMEIEALPKIDFVLLSHDHGDHFDQDAEKKLDKGLLILTPPDAAAKLQSKGFHNAQGLYTWDTAEIKKSGEKIKITAMPARHAPIAVQMMLPEVIGSMIEYQPQGRSQPTRIYISGDTLNFWMTREIPKRFPDIDTGFFHLGGTRLFGILLTWNAKEGIKAIKTIKPKEAIPIHFNDYNVFKSSLEDFKKDAAKKNLGSRIVYLKPGEIHEIPFRK